jgi:iron complex transport system permease protein
LAGTGTGVRPAPPGAGEPAGIQPGGERRGWWQWAAALGTNARLGLLGVLTVVTVILSFSFGRYPLSPAAVVGVLIGNVLHHATSFPHVDHTVLSQLRVPEVLSALLVGSGLACAGAAYQTTFRNPLVSPDILGVSAGAGFGGALGLLLGLPTLGVEVLAFAGGLVAVGLAVGAGRLLGGNSTIILVLAGVVIASVFMALISVSEYLANPTNTLPEITFWLLGGLANQTLGDLLIPAVIIAASAAALFAVRWPVTVLAAGEEEAQSLGINRGAIWTIVVVGSTLITATTVSIAGIIGWVGLLVPHIARFFVGPRFGRLLIASLLVGAIFVVVVDDVARSFSAAEIPLGILTALVGAPFFLLVLARARRQWV